MDSRPDRQRELLGQVRMRANSLRLDIQAFQEEFPGHGAELAMLAEVNGLLRSVHLTVVGEGEGDEVPVAVDDRFVLFDVFATSRGSAGDVREDRVARTALCMAWTERDVVVELHARGFPLEQYDRIVIEGWPSDQGFIVRYDRGGQSGTLKFKRM